MVVLLSRVVSQRKSPYGKVLRKQSESPKLSQVLHHNQDNIIISLYDRGLGGFLEHWPLGGFPEHKCSHHIR
jgi:hypothetical protein